MNDKLVTLRSITTTSGPYGLDELDQGILVGSESLVLGDVVTACIAVVTMGNDPDSDVWDLREETFHHLGNVPSDLGQTGVHTPCRIETENNIDHWSLLVALLSEQLHVAVEDLGPLASVADRVV
jgi:hypothetical protein